MSACPLCNVQWLHVWKHPLYLTAHKLTVPIDNQFIHPPWSQCGPDGIDNTQACCNVAQDLWLALGSVSPLLQENDWCLLQEGKGKRFFLRVQQHGTESLEIWHIITTKDPTMNLGTDYRLGLRGFLLVLGLGKFILPVWSLSLYMCPTANPLTKDTPSRLWCLLGLGAVWVWCAGTRACTNMEIQHAKRTVVASKLTHWGR